MMPVEASSKTALRFNLNLPFYVLEAKIKIILAPLNSLLYGTSPQPTHELKNPTNVQTNASSLFNIYYKFHPLRIALLIFIYFYRKTLTFSSDY